MDKHAPLIGGILMTALIFIMSVAYGFQYRFQDHVEVYFSAASLAYVFLVLVLTVYVFRWVVYPMESGSAIKYGFLVMALTWLLTLYFNSATLAPLPWFIVAAITLALPYGLFRFKSKPLGVLLLLGFGFTFFAYLALTGEMRAESANMLPLVTAGGRDFLAGLNPYTEDYSEIAAILNFHYLPGLWLPYAAIDWLGFDPRLLNLAILAFTIGSASWLAVRHEQIGTLALLLFPLLLSPPVAQMVQHGHVWPYWAVLGLLAAALLDGRFLWAAVFLGLLLTTRQLAVFIAAPLAIYIFNCTGLRRTVIYGLITLTVYFAVMLPFALQTPDFWQLTYLGLPGKGEAHALTGNPLDQLGITGIFYLLDLAGWVRVAQLAVIGLFLFLIARAGCITVERALALTGCMYLWTVSLNPFLYRYHYIPGFLLIITGLIFFVIHARHDSTVRQGNL